MNYVALHFGVRLACCRVTWWCTFVYDPRVFVGNPDVAMFVVVVQVTNETLRLSSAFSRRSNLYLLKANQFILPQLAQFVEIVAFLFFSFCVSMSRFFFSPACLCSGGGPLGNSTLTLAVWDLSRRLTTPKLKLQNLRVIACFFVFCLNLLHFFACVLRSHLKKLNCKWSESWNRETEKKLEISWEIPIAARSKSCAWESSTNFGPVGGVVRIGQALTVNWLRLGVIFFGVGCVCEVGWKVGFFTADYFRLVVCLYENFSLRFLFHFAV